MTTNPPARMTDVRTTLSHPLMPGWRTRVHAACVTSSTDRTWRVWHTTEVDVNHESVTHSATIGPDEAADLDPRDVDEDGDFLWLAVTRTMHTGVWMRDKALPKYDEVVAAFEAAGWEADGVTAWRRPIRDILGADLADTEAESLAKG